jgi:broad specificity phosphatase PhoE
MPPLFVYIRHGEALHNVANRIHGPIAYTLKENEDASLSEEGHRQTKEAGFQLHTIFGDRPVDVYSSPLSRCIQTAENASAHLNVQERILDDLLIERLGGGHVCNNRKTFYELAERFPGWDTEHIQDPPPILLEREPLSNVEGRMRQMWNWLQDAYKTSERGVLVVSHQESLIALWSRDFKNAEFLVVPQ